MIIPHYYEDPHPLHVGTMPNRVYYIPSSRRSDALVEHRETSDRFQLLNGSWRFRYYASIYDLQDAFYEVGYDASAFDSIPVPSVWQNHGYDHHQYTNIRYPFPADPPYVPKENPCGAYLYDFTYQKDATAPCAFLNFEGVASCFYVWLNGQFVGYSQVAHSTSEFDVTKFLQDGTNHLAVLVLKWCDGSYMEDQDMFRMHGMYKLNVGSYALATVACALVAVAGYTGSGDVKMMLLFTAIAALGQGPWQGDMNAVIASCSEYTWLTKHKRVDGTMYSCTSLGVKLGGGLGTAITGWLLAFSNYDKALAVQPESCINMLKLMYLVIPFVLDAIITFILSRMKVEEANDKIRAEMKN